MFDRNVCGRIVLFFGHAILRAMNDQDDDQRRDALLLNLLKTPPQPRPKRDRAAKPKLTSGGVESAPR
jgi:hypothetical protein